MASADFSRGLFVKLSFGGLHEIGLWGEKKPVYVHRKSSAPTKELGTNPGACLYDGADDLCRIGLQTL